MYNETYLQHHGVLGMKWGVRKDQGSFYRSSIYNGLKRNVKKNTKKVVGKYRQSKKTANSTARITKDGTFIASNGVKIRKSISENDKRIRDAKRSKLTNLIQKKRLSEDDYKKYSSERDALIEFEKFGGDKFIDDYMDMSRHVGKLSEKYKPADAVQDYKNFGKSTVKKVDEHLKNGYEYEKAISVEAGKKMITSALMSTAVTVAVDYTMNRIVDSIINSSKKDTEVKAIPQSKYDPNKLVERGRIQH